MIIFLHRKTGFQVLASLNEGHVNLLNTAINRTWKSSGSVRFIKTRNSFRDAISRNLKKKKHCNSVAMHGKFYKFSNLGESTPALVLLHSCTKSRIQKPIRKRSRKIRLKQKPVPEVKDEEKDGKIEHTIWIRTLQIRSRRSLLHSLSRPLLPDFLQLNPLKGKDAIKNNKEFKQKGQQAWDRTVRRPRDAWCASILERRRRRRLGGGRTSAGREDQTSDLVLRRF